MNNRLIGRIRQSEHILALKVKTESNGLGVLKTIVVLSLIVLQVAFLILANLYFMRLFSWVFNITVIFTVIACIHVLSSDYHGQAKATWVLFLMVSFSFGYIIYILSDKRVLFARSRKKYNKILKETEGILQQSDLSKIKNKDVKTNCDYLYNAGRFITTDGHTTYFSSGTKLFDDILETLKSAKEYIFIEYFIVSDGVLLDRFLNILEEKVKQGVDVRIVYDDMGSHRTLKAKTKAKIVKMGVKLQAFNRLVPVFNIALNLRNHRKIVVVDGRVAYTGGANLADEYINEKRMHGFWKDTGIKVEGSAVDNFTLAYLTEWKFLTNQEIDYLHYLGKAENITSDGVNVPFVSGPNYNFSIAQNMYANEIANAKEKLYIMTPYFIPDETITNLLINKARSGIDVRIILPDVADKKFVYTVSRNNAEKLIKYGIRLYVMKNSFVHSKVILTEHSAIVGSINMDLRSFTQQFESAIFTSEQSTLSDINIDFENTLTYSEEINSKNKRRNHLFYRALAGIFNLISPFM
ncbi:MAG: cardiolipin synthase [Clostridiales bacterium]|nr:cardiolipin synthase [Clostridiales bacterium]